MRLSLIAAAALASFALGPLAAGAKVVSEGKPSPGGYYWQVIQKGDGKIQYLCRSTKEAAIQKNAKCDGAKAIKP